MVLAQTQETSSAPRLSARKRFLFRTVLVAIGLAAGLAITEILLRVLPFTPQTLRCKRTLTEQSHPGVKYQCYWSNPNGEFQPLPDISRGAWRLRSSSLAEAEIPLSQIGQTPWCVADRTSDQGLRDRHYDPLPPPDKLRLAIVGDSFVRGEGVPVERSLPKQIEATLGTDHYEVMNAGFVGLGTAEEVSAARDAVTELKAQRVVLVFIPNDIALPRELRQRQEYINDLINIRDEHLARHNEKMWYRHSLRVVQLVGAFFELRRITRETVTWYFDSYDPACNPEGLRLLAEDFRALAKMPDCRVAVVLYPLMYGLEGAYPLNSIHSRVAQMVREAGLPVLDLAPAFKGQRSSSLQVHPSDHHPNSRGHAIAARAICEWLRRDAPGFLAVPAPGRPQSTDPPPPFVPH